MLNALLMRTFRHLSIKLWTVDKRISKLKIYTHQNLITLFPLLSFQDTKKMKIICQREVCTLIFNFCYDHGKNKNRKNNNPSNQHLNHSAAHKTCMGFFLYFMFIWFKLTATEKLSSLFGYIKGIFQFWCWPAARQNYPF